MLLQVESPVVMVKPLIQPETGIQDECTDKGTRSIAASLEQFGQGCLVLAQRSVGEIPDPMIHGIGAGHDGAEGGQGKRHLHHGVSKQNSIFRQTIYVRRAYTFVAIALDMVGPQGIDANQKDVDLVSRLGLPGDNETWKRRSSGLRCPTTQQHESQADQPGTPVKIQRPFLGTLFSGLHAQHFNTILGLGRR